MPLVLRPEGSPGVTSGSWFDWLLTFKKWSARLRPPDCPGVNFCATDCPPRLSRGKELDNAELLSDPSGPVFPKPWIFSEAWEILWDKFEKDARESWDGRDEAEAERFGKFFEKRDDPNGSGSRLGTGVCS